MAKNKPGKGLANVPKFDLGFGLPAAASKEEAAALLRERLENGLRLAAGTHSELEPIIQRAMTNPAARIETQVAMLQGQIREPLLQSHSQAQAAADSARRNIEGLIQARAGQAYAESQSLQPRVPSMQTALSRTLGVDVVAPGIVPPGKYGFVGSDPGEVLANQNPNVTFGPGGEPIIAAPTPTMPGQLYIPAPGQPPAASPPVQIFPPGWHPGDPPVYAPPPINLPPGVLPPTPPTVPTNPVQPPPQTPPDAPQPPIGPPDAPIDVPPPPPYTQPPVAIPPGNPGEIHPPCSSPQEIPYDSVVWLPGGTPKLPAAPFTCPPGYRLDGQYRCSSELYKYYRDHPGAQTGACVYAMNHKGGFACDWTMWCTREQSAPAPVPTPPANPPTPPPAPPQNPNCPPCDPKEPPAQKPPEPGDPRTIRQDACLEIPEAKVLGLGSVSTTVLYFLGLAEKGKKIAPEFFKWLNWGSFRAGDWLLAVINYFFDSGFKPLDKLIKSVRCDDPAAVDLAVDLAGLQFLEQWSGVRSDAVSRPIEQQLAYLCPTEFPSPAEADAMFLADQIDEKKWKCLVRIGHQMDDEREALRKAKRSRLTGLDYLNLLRRDKITNQEFTDAIRSLGYTDEEVPQQMQDLGEALPGVADLIRMMVRDTADPAIVNKFGLDDEFKAKWAGDLVKWGDAQGVTEEVAQHYWRAHWDTPSYTQLTTMLHRFSRLPAGDPRYVSIEDVETALKQNDMLPFWVQKMIGIAYHPVNPGDAYKGRKNGTFTHEEVIEILQQNGYDQADAEKVANAWEDQIDQELQRVPLARLYLQWAVSRSDLQDFYRRRDRSEESIRNILLDLDQRRDGLAHKTCQRNWKKRFLTGEWDEGEAVSKLTADGVDNATAQQTVNVWKCDLKTKSKALAASPLCSMLDAGLIDEGEMHRRLTTMGYDGEDATLLISQCSRRIAKRMSADEAKRLKAQQRETERQQREQEKQESISEKRRRAGLAGIKKCQAAQEGRDRNILAAAMKMAEKTEEEPWDAQQRIKDIIQGLALRSQSGPVSLAAAAVVIARSAAASDWSAFETALGAYAASGVHPDLACIPDG